MLVVERRSDCWAWGIIALLLIGAFAWVMHVYWVPVTPGVDQNGYLVGGKLFAATGSSGFRPDNVYSFVGRMWIQAADGRVFPKYPLGLSIIYAAMLKLGGANWGQWLCFTVSPIAMALALVATFLFVRQLVGSFAAVLAVLIVGTSPVTMGLADNPNSHATALCLVTWGMYLAMQWWQKNGLWRAILAGLLIGSAVSIRYTEGLVAIPMGIILLMNLRPRVRRSWIQSIAMLLAWALPVVSLVVYNWVSFHHITGYDPTNESTGFSFAYFQNNWETMVREMYNTGLFFILPFSVMGLVLMWRWSARVTLVLSIWIIPNLLLYSFYYWAPDNASISYLRFFLTIFPALALAAVWAMKWMVDLAAAQSMRWTPLLAIGVVLLIACGMDVHTALGITEPEARIDGSLQAAAREVLTVCPAGSTIFASDHLLDYLQFAGDFHLYDMQQFDRRQIRRLEHIDPTQPNGLQPQRAKALYDRLRDASTRDVIAEQNRLMTESLQKNQRVFMIYPDKEVRQAREFVTRRSFTSSIVGTWSEALDPRLVKRRKQAFAAHLAVMAGQKARLFARWAAANNGQVRWDILEVKATKQTSHARRVKTHISPS